MFNIKNPFRRPSPEEVASKRTPAFMKAATKMAEYIDALPLESKQIKRLVGLIANVTSEAETGAVEFAFCHAFEHIKDMVVGELKKTQKDAQRVINKTVSKGTEEHHQAIIAAQYMDSFIKALDDFNINEG
jgi:hypothetical protein